jgi:hypothetical protein
MRVTGAAGAGLNFQTASAAIVAIIKDAAPHIHFFEAE